MAVTRFYPGEIQDDRYPIRYKVNDDGTISTLQSPPIGDRNQKRINIDNYNSQSGGFPFTNIADAQNEVAKKQQASIKNLQDTYEKRLASQIQISQPNMATQLENYYEELSKLENPKTTFDAKFYLANNPDVAGDRYYGARPEEHYNKHGRGEGRSPNQEAADLASGVTARKIAELRPKIQQEENYNSLASQIQKLTQRSPLELGGALSQLSSSRNYGSEALSGKLNYQVSDDQILNDYNTSKLSRLNSVVDRGNTQIAGIQEQLNAAQKLIDQLPSGDARRNSNQTYINDLKSDLTSVQGAVADATQQVKNYKPITSTSPEGASQITSFREYLQLPEERASQQLRQIDPESYQTSIELGKRYREMATAPIGQTQNAQTEAFRAELEKGYRDYSKSPIGETQDAQTEAYRAQLQKEIQGYSLGKIGATTSPEAEALRRQVEGETAAQLALGSRLGAEEQRQYQQYSRGAQAARGNIFGVAPAVEEAVTTGMAGEARRQARYGAASQFLSSGQTTSDALARDVQLREALQQGRYQAGGAMLASGQTVSDAMARDVQLRNALQQSKLGAGGQFLSSGQTVGDALKADLAFRDALQQNRMGAAANFIAGGPSVYNLAQARTAGQQGAFQNYIQANQALPGGFNQQPSTAAPFYQAVDQSIPVALTNTFANLYGSQANYLANTYGAQVGAISRQPNGFQNFATAAGGAFDLARGFGALGSAGILCWVAREVYGEDNPKWLQFREWMLTRASDNLRNYYIEYGERIAESIRNRPKVKDIIRRWMDKKVKEMYGS